jgi:hypothetical protein
MIRYTTGRPLDFKPFGQSTGLGPSDRQELTHEAVVVDVIVNDSHPDYAPDGYNVGAIQFRALKSDSYRDQNKLNWALPIESNITDYPLLNEIVFIYSSLNRFYYGRKLNTSSRITNHAMFGLNEELAEEVSRPAKIKELKASVANRRVDKSAPTPKLGKYFKESEKVMRLRSDEGDIIYEGRSGQSIRFGAAWKSGTTFQSGKTDQAPNLLFRVGPDLNQKPSVPSKFGLVKEDIDKDASSIWMVSDQIISLAYATAKIPQHTKSIKDFPSRLDGNQIVINTDRFIINTKNDKLMGFSAKGIHWTSVMDFSVDAQRDYLSQLGRDSNIQIGNDSFVKIARNSSIQIGNDEALKIGRNWTIQIGNDESVKIGQNLTAQIGNNWTGTVGNFYEVSAGSRYSMIAPKVYVGLKQNNSQPIPCGASLAQFLQRFLDVFITTAAAHIASTATPGSPSSLNPTIVAGLNQLKADVVKGALASFNSTVAYTTK